MIRIKASLPSYRQIETEISERKTVEDLKQSLCSQLGIEPELTRLLLHGKPVPGKTRISKLDENATILVDYLWARHLLVWGIKGQQKLRAACVLLAGAGALGNEVAKNLAMLGIGRIVIADRDTVELSNISRMIFFDNPSLGRNKAEALAGNVHKKYSHVETAAFRGNIEDLPLKVYLDSDVIVSGLDNVISRSYLSQISRKYSIPMVDGGILGLTARVQSYIPPEAACPICIFPTKQYSKIVGLRNPCDAPLEEQTVPSLSTTISAVSSIVSQEVIKLILGRDEFEKTKKWPDNSGAPLTEVLFFDLKSNRYTPMPLKRNIDCFICGKEGTAKSTATRFNISFEDIGKDQVKAIRKAANLKDEKLLLFLETSNGERKIDTKSKLRKGEYIRAIAVNSEGSSTESICKIV